MPVKTATTALLVSSCVLTVSAIAMSPATSNIEKLSPAAEAIIPAEPKLEKLVGGFTWTEGPVWMPGKYLLFADITSNSIRKWVPGSEKATVFLQPSGFIPTEAYGGKEPGSNGMTIDKRGRLTVAGHARRNVWRLETDDPHGQVTVLADSYEGKKLNSPNDVVYKSDGSLYFTDPPYGLATQSDKDPKKELSFKRRIPHSACADPRSRLCPRATGGSGERSAAAERVGLFTGREIPVCC